MILVYETKFVNIKILLQQQKFWEKLLQIM